MDSAKRPLVLIVEDEQIIARNIARYLEHMDYEVGGICSSASEVMESVRQRRPDIVLMDIRIDGSEDGIMVAERLHDLHGIPVIYLSALLDDETVQRVKATQPFGFLAKPFSQKELQVALEIALYKSSMERRLSEQEVHIQRLIDSMGQGFCLLDSDHRIRYANHALARMLGHPVEDLIGHSIDAWVNLPAEGTPTHQAWRDQQALELSLTPDGGRDRACVLTPQHLYDAAGGYSGSFLSFTDLESVVRHDAGKVERELHPSN
jgi:PAS domain S-box-containing protein